MKPHHKHLSAHGGQGHHGAHAAKPKSKPAPRPHHDPFSEPFEAYPLPTYQPKNSGTSWAVLDAQGNLIEAMSHNPHLQQDPASTTKLMTLYTVLTRIKNGQLPEDFIEKNSVLINRMLVQSDNHAAQAVAELADPRHSYRHFCEEMTVLAHEVGLRDSQFLTPEGYPMVGTYSTAADMARLPFLLQRDFPQYVSLAGRIRADGADRINTGSQLLTHGVMFGKTGTGDSADQHFSGYGGHGKFAYTGAAKGGYVAVAAAVTRDERNGVVLGAVQQLAKISEAQAQTQAQVNAVRQTPWGKIDWSRLSCLPGMGLVRLPCGNGADSPDAPWPVHGLPTLSTPSLLDFQALRRKMERLP